MRWSLLAGETLLAGLLVSAHARGQAHDSLDPLENSNERARRGASARDDCAEVYKRYREDPARDHRELFSSQKLIWKKIGNRELLATPEEFDILEKSLGSQPPPNWGAERCVTVFECLGHVLGSPEAGYLLLNIAKRTGYVPMLDQSRNPKGHPQLWKRKELESMDAAYRRVPPQFLNLAVSRQIYRKTDGWGEPAMGHTLAYARTPQGNYQSGFKLDRWVQGKDPFEKKFAVKKPGFIMVFGSTYNRPESERQHTLLHELGHHVDTAFSFTSRPEFAKLGKAEDPISDYAKKNRDEAFAELFAEFFLIPEVLEIKAPRHYAFMKKVLAETGDGTAPSQIVKWPELDRFMTPAFIRQKLMRELPLSGHAFSNPGFNNSSNILRGYQFPDRKFDAWKCAEGNRFLNEQAALRYIEPLSLLSALVARAGRECSGRRWDRCLTREDLKKVYDSNSAYKKLDRYFGGIDGIHQALQASSQPLASQFKRNIGAKGDLKYFFGPPGKKGLEILRQLEMAREINSKRTEYRDLYEYLLQGVPEAEAQGMLVRDVFFFPGATSLLWNRKLMPKTVLELESLSKRFRNDNYVRSTVLAIDRLLAKHAKEKGLK